MFLHELGASDPRFHTLTFHDGMNLLLADKTAESTTGDSRNGAGKSSFVKILRYLLGGNLDKSLKNPDLNRHVFRTALELDSESVTDVRRPTSPMTRVCVNGRSQAVDEWRSRLGRVFGLSDRAQRPTLGQLTGQLVRTYFHDAVRVDPHDSDVACGIRIGYLLGFSPDVLNKAIEVSELEKHRTALRKAIRAGALPSLRLSDAELRAQLAQVKSRRRRMEHELAGFRVDEQYADHQRRADQLSAELRELNDSALALRRRRREIEEVTRTEQPPAPADDTDDRLRTMYEEVGLALPDAAIRRFDEVVVFHASVIRNRRLFLQSELESVQERLRTTEERITRLDAERARVMELLDQSMALDTFRKAEAELTGLDATIADLEQRLQQAEALTEGDLKRKAMALSAQTALRTEYAERAEALDEAMALFSQLGREIYSDRDVSLLIEPTGKGVLKVVPRIDGDSSTGISEVKTFLLDIVCLVTAIRGSRAPRILVHDSLLFDSMDERQIASCLNIGARLADEYGFQYIVTMNSDRLEAVEREGFERRDYVIDPVLTDKGDAGGLFGFRFV